MAISGALRVAAGVSGMPTRRQLLLVMRDEPSLSAPASALVRMIRERERLAS